MLWPCHQNPALLAFKALEGSYSFDATPMAPLGNKVLATHKPNQHLLWSFCTLNAWYISPSLQHYRCIKIIMRNTGGMDTFCYKITPFLSQLFQPLIASLRQPTDSLRP